MSRPLPPSRNSSLVLSTTIDTRGSLPSGVLRSSAKRRASALFWKGGAQAAEKGDSLWRYKFNTHSWSLLGTGRAHSSESRRCLGREGVGKLMARRVRSQHKQPSKGSIAYQSYDPSRLTPSSDVSMNGSAVSRSTSWPSLQHLSPTSTATTPAPISAAAQSKDRLSS